MNTTFTLDKQSLMEKSRAEIAQRLPEGLWSEKQKLALACRILFAQGHDSGLAGQITARGEQHHEYYTQPFGFGFDEITPDNLLTVNADLQVLQGEGLPNPANRFHSWIYQARPDVRCIIHTHPLHISALSMLEIPLKISHMDSCMLYEEVAFLKKWPGVPVGNEEGEIITAVLGNKRAALLCHHGLVVAGQSIEEACMVAIQCERAAKLQLLAQAVGDIKDIEPELAREAHDWILQEKRSKAAFAYYARRIAHELNFGQ
ncbi:aldolase [Alkalimonas amylolytica]|uniref:L-fuculose-phosphate aldolase n=1 Tax=Alkalimonas amylolytica TaxID=152573 RepID=A0A1H4AW41_ALKAM|nr:aldolase [Alkalimonas amylolytica]SEA40077.1 L-fuculose-phosphate aldolase [Alkalimonas amylolytica]